jgi:hypothetical protein
LSSHLEHGEDHYQLPAHRQQSGLAKSFIASLIIVGRYRASVKAPQANTLTLAFCHAEWLLMSHVGNTPVRDQTAPMNGWTRDPGNL